MKSKTSTARVLNYNFIVNSISQRAISCSKVNAKPEAVQETVNSLMRYIKLFNSTGAYDNRILGRDFSEIDVIDEFAIFLTPRSVRLTASDLNNTDLLVRTEKDPVDAATLSYEDFVNLQLKFRGYFKKDSKVDVTNLATVKVDESLTNILPRAAVEVEGDLMVRYVSEPFIPIVLSREVSYFYRNEYFNSTAEQVVADYLLPVIY